jgi:hypothetical protein
MKDNVRSGRTFPCAVLLLTELPQGRKFHDAPGLLPPPVPSRAPYSLRRKTIKASRFGNQRSSPVLVLRIEMIHDGSAPFGVRCIRIKKDAYWSVEGKAFFSRLLTIRIREGSHKIITKGSML